jgi:hypothetical protein
VQAFLLSSLYEVIKVWAIDFNVVKKQLFTTPLPTTHKQAPPSTSASTAKKNYEMREDALWTKLFV